jgi:hypothetical protein
MQVTRRCGMKKAIGALAHRLAVILHRFWVDGTEPERPSPQHDTATDQNVMRVTGVPLRAGTVSLAGRWMRVSSHVRLDLPDSYGKAAQKIVPTLSSNPMMEGPAGRFRREARARE